MEPGELKVYINGTLEGKFQLKGDFTLNSLNRHMFMIMHKYIDLARAKSEAPINKIII